MKIGLIFSSIYASPVFYKDRIFAPRDLFIDLANGLTKKGHQVFVFATPDLPTEAKLIPTDYSYVQNTEEYFKFRNVPSQEQKWLKTEFAKRKFELNTIVNAYTAHKKENFDILHAYHDSSLFLTHYFQLLKDAPVLYSLHDPLPPLGSYEFSELDRFSSHMYVSISEAQRLSKLKLNFIDTIYHGIHLDHFSFQAEASDYILFMGRLVPEKGLHSAIKVALDLNIKLEIGTQFPDLTQESEYFKSQIKPYLSDPVIGEPGMVAGKDKLLLYKQAKALLFPIEWEEPFGMVMIEAMACGTPVIAYNRGSVLEIVRDGVTGFIIDPDDETRPGKGNWIIKKKGIAGLIEAIKRINEIDRHACRKHVEEHFTVEKMVEGYERVYEKVIRNKQHVIGDKKKP